MNAPILDRALAGWSDWRRFPDPRRGDLMVAPIGAGVFELRHVSTGGGVLFGAGEHVAARLTNLLPASLSPSLRKNMSKRQYVLRHLGDLEYRTLTCDSRIAADEILAAFDPRRYRFRV